MPCRASQILAKFALDSLASFTPTFFRQCMHPAPHTRSLHLYCEDSHCHPDPCPAARSRAASIHLLPPSSGNTSSRTISQLGLWHNFVVAIDLVDGDGGYLVCHIPGLHGYLLQARAPAIMWQEGMHGYLVPFRCHGQDALELEHLYHCQDGTHHHLGYKALCAARSAVATAAKVLVLVHTAGEVDVHGRRLVRTFAIATSQGTSTSIGERLLQAGLSYPLPGAPTTYTAAFCEAQVSAQVCFTSPPPPSLATMHQLHPT